MSSDRSSAQSPVSTRRAIRSRSRSRSRRTLEATWRQCPLRVATLASVRTHRTPRSHRTLHSSEERRGEKELLAQALALPAACCPTNMCSHERREALVRRAPTKSVRRGGALRSRATHWSALNKHEHEKAALRARWAFCSELEALRVESTSGTGAQHEHELMLTCTESS